MFCFEPETIEYAYTILNSEYIRSNYNNISIVDIEKDLKHIDYEGDSIETVRKKYQGILKLSILLKKEDKYKRLSKFIDYIDSQFLELELEKEKIRQAHIKKNCLIGTAIAGTVAWIAGIIYKKLKSKKKKEEQKPAIEGIELGEQQASNEITK